MAAESEPPEIPDEMSPEEAREYLSRFLGRQNLDEHATEWDSLQAVLRGTTTVPWFLAERDRSNPERRRD